MFLSLHYIIQTRLDHFYGRNQTLSGCGVWRKFCYQLESYDCPLFYLLQTLQIAKQDFVIRCDNSNQLNAKTRKFEIVLIKAWRLACLNYYYKNFTHQLGDQRDGASLSEKVNQLERSEGGKSGSYFSIGIPGIMSIPMRVGLSRPASPPDLVAPVLSWENILVTRRVKCKNISVTWARERKLRRFSTSKNGSENNALHGVLKDQSSWKYLASFIHQIISIM